MNYLKEYNLNDDDIKEIIDNIDDADYNEYVTKEDKIKSILDYFKSIGITNLKDLLMNKSYLFYETLEVIKNRIRKELVTYINEDIAYLDTIGI